MIMISSSSAAAMQSAAEHRRVVQSEICLEKYVELLCLHSTTKFNFSTSHYAEGKVEQSPIVDSPYRTLAEFKK